MKWTKSLCIFALLVVLVGTIGPAMADDDKDSVVVRDGEGNDITKDNHRVSDDDENKPHASDDDDSEDVEASKGDEDGDGFNENYERIKPEDIYSENKVMGQEVKEGNFLDFINIRRWLNLIFVNGYVSAFAGLIFAVVGLVLIFGSGLSILKNGAMMGLAMLSLDGDVDEKVDKVHDAERSTVTLIRGLGVTALAMSIFCFMINFFG